MNLFWKGIARKGRLEAISEVRSVVDKHGSMIDAKAFSDLSLTLFIEVEEQKLRNLFHDLEQCVVLDASEPSVSSAARVTCVYLNLDFPGGKGDLVHVTPDVPG